MYKPPDNYADLIKANLADVLVEPYIRACNLSILSGDLLSHWGDVAEERHEFIRDARDRGSEG